jgi:hypothetical protein
MVRAILDGTKTQTRRIVKPDPGPYWYPTVGLFNPTVIKNGGYETPGPEIFSAFDETCGVKCPYGKPGDRLWVRENYRMRKYTLGTNNDLDGVRANVITDSTRWYEADRQAPDIFGKLRP